MLKLKDYLNGDYFSTDTPELSASKLYSLDIYAPLRYR
jgi:hypothetical protein